MLNKLALKGLLLFFGTMALLTLIARAADSLLIANVSAEPAMRSALSHEAISMGFVQAGDAQMVWALQDVRVARVAVRNGTTVEKGDPLVELDMQSVSGLLDEAQFELDQLVNERAQIELSDVDAKKNNEVKLHALKLEALELRIVQAQRKLGALQALRSNGGQVRSPADGVVTALTVQAGKQTSAEALMQLANLQGELNLMCRISRDEAEHVLVGDEALVTPPGKTVPERAPVMSVSQPDEKGQVDVVLTLPNVGFEIGMSCTVKFAKKTQGYWAVVPLAALRSDSRGSYVLVLREKNSVLGLTQVAERVPVIEEDRDGARVAIQGGILDTDLVITGWDKVVEAGDRVRRVSS